MTEPVVTSPHPDFGTGIERRDTSCTPSELYRALFLDLENNVHFIEPAFVFLSAELERTQLPGSLQWAASPREWIPELLAWARDTPTVPPTGGDAESWLSPIVREFAPVGLSDGAWLHGALLSNVVESEVGMRMLKQLMRRFGGPGIGEAYVERYAGLLRSLNISPSVIERDDAANRCSAVSYEHALLGLCLGLFPVTFGPECLGFNLWMSSIGPCPLLWQLQPALREHSSNLRYLDLHGADEFELLARQAIERELDQHRDEGVRSALATRIVRGFVAAQDSYLRWEQALHTPVEPRGTYRAPQDAEQLAEYAFERYGALSNAELYHCLSNPDLHPAVRLFARGYVEQVFETLAEAFQADARLNSSVVPHYSERAIAEIVAEQHEKNVRSRGLPITSLVSSNSEEAVRGIQEVFDGCWLQGFVDVQRASFEEYGWLFRIYASEHGDGDFSWNHCQIFRKAFDTLGPDVYLPKTDPRLCEIFEISVAALVSIAVPLNSRHFMPEILGINLGIESTGVGGSYIDQWKTAEQEGNPWRALAWRLHNSIDNYADGHTKWSLFAVQSFMRRVRAGDTRLAVEQWSRIWRLWRCRDILVHGTDEEQSALSSYFAGAASDAVQEA